MIFWVLITGIIFGVASVLLPVADAIIFTLINLLFNVLVFYVNILFLFPRFYQTSKINLYIIYIFFSIAIATALLAVVEQNLIEPREIVFRHSVNPSIMMVARSFLWFVLMVTTGTVYLIQKRYREQILLHKEVQENKLKTELKLLRSQINPHFLFNALNNIYSLSYQKSEKAPESILKLSGMLRYVIEDCTTDTVEIGSEIEYLENFIAFQRMKAPNIMNVDFKYKELDLNIKVAPMLFIPFLENSFKYSKIEEFQNAHISIEIKSDDKRNLIFSLENSIPPTAKARPGSGTGIKNVKKRLNIIYPDKHTITINESEETFRCNLNIDTHEA